MFVRRRRTVGWIIDGEYSYVRSELICERLGHQNMHCARRCRQTLGVRASHKPEKRCCEYGGKNELLHVTGGEQRDKQRTEDAFHGASPSSVGGSDHTAARV